MRQPARTRKTHVRPSVGTLAGWGSCLCICAVFVVDYADPQAGAWERLAAALGILSVMVLGATLHVRNRTIDYLRLSLKHQREHIQHLSVMLRRRNAPFN